jgi:hypothetical protein
MIPIPILRSIYRLKRRNERRCVTADVDYALEMARTHEDIARQAKIDLSQASILEIGPGLSFAPQLVFASHGARVTVADPYLAAWDDNYHPRFYEEFRARWAGPSSAIDIVLGAKGYPPSVIRRVVQPAEQLSGLRGQLFDLIISNAVLEHVSDLSSACRVFANLTRIGGANSHQIDFRDHLNPSRPLEFLIRSDMQFLIERTRHPSQGNRVRHSECIQIFGEAGFNVENTSPNCFAEDQYLSEFLPRLRISNSRYREWPVSDLRILGARFFLRRTDAAVEPIK